MKEMPDSGHVLVTDTSACLTGPLPDQLRVLPLRIHVDDRDLVDGPSAAAQVLDALRNERPVKTSPPAAADYLLAIEAASADAVVVTPATEFTHMYEHARRAAAFASAHVEVVDSRTAAVGQGLVVGRGLEVLAQGGDLDDVAAACRQASDAVRLVATLPSLERIEQGGRVPSPDLGVAARAGIQPVFTLTSGRVSPVAIPRDARTALERLVGYVEEHGGMDASEVVVFHAGRPEAAGELAERTRARVVGFSPAMAVHTGPGVVGVSWIDPA